jgi:signal transduction histidine kinase
MTSRSAAPPSRARTAGLTHELNNPAGAGVRAAAELRERVAGTWRRLGAIAAGPYDRGTLETLIKLQEAAVSRVPQAGELPPLEASDREDAITGWLESRGLDDGWQLAPTLVAAGLDIAWLEHVAASVEAAALIPAHASELNEAWTNLIDNAVSAMGEAGVLTVRTGMDRDQVVVVIGDTGPGVPSEIQDRIFDPLFTTKPVGEGTGLGLEVTWRIVVNNHHGDIQVESVPGDTRFLVRLPTG